MPQPSPLPSVRSWTGDAHRVRRHFGTGPQARSFEPELILPFEVHLLHTALASHRGLRSSTHVVVSPKAIWLTSAATASRVVPNAPLVFDEKGEKTLACCLVRYHRDANGNEICSNGISFRNVHGFNWFALHVIPTLQPNNT